MASGPWELYGDQAPVEEEGPWTAYRKTPEAVRTKPQMNAADMLARFALGGAGIKYGVEEAAKHARGLTTGEIPPTPENVLSAATLAVPLSPVRLGLGGAAKLPPRLATTIEDLERVGTEAVTRPTGAVVPQAEAGAIVRRAVTPSREAPPVQPDRIRRVDEWPFQKGPMHVREPRPIEPEGGLLDVPLRVRALLRSGAQDQNVAAHIVDMASSAKEGGSRLAGLSHIRKAVPEADWASVQGASLAQMGRTGGPLEAAGFDPIIMLEKYRDMPAAGKGLLFGESGKAGLRTHLDSLVDDMTKIEKLRIPTGPMDALKEALGMPVPIRYMAEPKTAAPLAQWSKTFTRLMGEGRSPTAIAAFKLATNNLENSIGTEIDRDKLIGVVEAGTRSIADQNKPLPEEEEARRRVRERSVETPRAEGIYPRSFAGIVGMLAQMPRQLPYEKMRQSANVSDFSRAQPPAPDLADLYGGRFLPNAEYRERMLMPGDPADPLPAAAGLNDIVRFARRR